MPDKEAWEIVLSGYAPVNTPYASVMTLPATGSEMNRGSVISRKETKEKYAFYSVDYPQFCILDPEVTYSLPKNQLANGLSDVFVHVMEQYLTTTGQSRVMDRWAEGILHTIIEIAPKVLSGTHDYDTMADFMLSATLALNDMIRMGVTEDWATHMIGHELTALYGIAHGASLAIVLPGTMSVMREQKRGKLLQYADRIWNITEGGEDERINLAIARTVDFFNSLGQATRLSEAGIPEEAAAEVERRFNERDVHYGEEGNVTGKVARQILESRK